MPSRLHATRGHDLPAIAASPLPARLAAGIFLAFSAGYFLSYFFRNVNAVIAKDLARDLGLSGSELGLLTSAFFVTYGIFQLPLGVLLDRCGPRRVVATLLCITAAGAALFGIAEGFASLALARALIGLGVSACLMGSLKAFTLWFPPSRLATLSGWFIFLGASGGLAATAPVEAALGVLGWRAMFHALAVASLASAALIALCVPESLPPGAGASWRAQFGTIGRIFMLPLFWRLALPFMVTHAAYQALQTLWLGPWLADVGGYAPEPVARMLLVSAGTYALGSVFFGSFADRLSARGITRLTTYKAGLSLSFAAFLCIALDLALPRGAVLGVYGFTVISGAIAFALVTPQLPAAISGRAITAVNFGNFMLSFAFQWGIGAALRAYPAADGRYAPEAYTAALLAIGVAQFVVLVWLLPLNDRALVTESR